jgi:hypothetical protein
LALSSPAFKNFPLHREAKSPSYAAPSRPEKGAYRDRHGRWDGMRWTRQRRVRLFSQGGFPVSEQTAHRRTSFNAFAEMRSAAHGQPSIGRGRCVRQNRVVLALVAGAKSAEVGSAQPGATRSESAGDGGKTNSSPGRARHKPLKPLRREGRVFRVPVVDDRVLSTLCTRGYGCSGHPAFPAPFFSWADEFAKLGHSVSRDSGSVSGACSGGASFETAFHASSE